MPKTPQESAPKKLERVVVEKTGALSPDDSVQTAGERMRSMDANAWPVAEGRKLVGAIDHPDPDRDASRHGHDPQATRVGDTMRHEAVYCYEDQDAAEADRIMKEHKMNHLPVVDREMRIVGILSRADVKQPEPAAEEESSAPVEDWKPGESRAHGRDGESAGSAAGADDNDGGGEPRGYSREDSVVDAERFPFRAPVDGAEVR